MSRPLKRFFLFALTGSLFLAAVALLVRFVLMVSFERLEQDATQQSLRQVERALDAELRQMSVISNDYANWDEAFDFVRTRNPRFAETNFSKPGLREMNVNFVYLVDENGADVFSAEQYSLGDRYDVPASQSVRNAVRAQLTSIQKRISRGFTKSFLLFRRNWSRANPKSKEHFS